ncbi:MAG TPA: 2-dehydropantoate 2-reductase, partial [Longimicrobiales bacterium]|nr:2-dehydropantoate 2-reductase [Longimicrobiales bacterium]
MDRGTRERAAVGVGDAAPRVAVVGVGALGGFIAGRLATNGAAPVLLDTGDRLRALRERGLRVIERDGTELDTSRCRVAEDPAEVGACDLVLLAVKAHDLPRAAPAAAALLGEGSVVLPLQNGIPWWYFQRHGGPLEGTRLRTLDPDGVLERALPVERVLGCVAYPAACRGADGTAHHVEGDRFAIGELDGSRSERAAKVAEWLETGGLRARVIEDIRAEIWLKALGSLSLNPVSALTGATMAAICRDPRGRELVRALMVEAESVAAALGVTLRRTVEERIAGAERVGEHRTSMLQDVDAGRPLEVDALVGAVVEMAELTGVPAPNIRAVHACAALLDARIREEAAGRGPGSVHATRDGKTVRIRPMRPEDKPAVMALLRKWDMAPRLGDTAAERSGLDEANAFVAIQDDVVVGTAGFLEL